MNCNTLYIIGNGFDLKHNIPSNYSDFAEFVKDQNYNLYTKIEKCLSNLSPEGLWSNFEEALGNPNLDELIKDLNHNQQIHRDYPIGIDKSELGCAFRDWVISLKQYIRTNVTIKKQSFHENAYYLSFNYTNTLEDLYGIKEHICHIHEYVDSKDKDKEDAFAGYIVGYGDKQEKEITERIKALNISFSDQQDLQQALDYHKKEYKQERLKEFVSGKHFSDIIVLGHSLGLIDQPYFTDLIEQYPKARWQIGYYDTRDHIRKINRYKEIGINNPEFFHDK